MSGYSVCNKLKKDDALRAIPLVVISAEATPETFEQHRKLKTRAEDYLIKPFPPETLVERLAALVGLPEPAHAADEEVVTLADVELEAGAAGEIPPAAFSGGRSPDEDDDLRLLDDAFDSISRGEPPPPRHDEPLEPAPLLLADDDVLEAPAAAPASAAAPPPEPPRAARAEAAVPAVEDDEPFAPLGAAPPAGPAVHAPAAAPAPPPPTTEALLREAGIPLLAAEPPAALDAGGDAARAELELVRAELGERDGEARALREEVARLREAADESEIAAGARDSELRAARARLEAVQGPVRKLESDLHAAREEARLGAERAGGLERELASLRGRLEDAEQLASRRGAEIAEAVTRAESAGRTADELRTEASVLRAEADGLRAEAERRGADLRRRLAELEAQAARHEERVVKAYQKIKGDERLREKVRKALGVALQLLDERLPPEGPAEAGTPPERPAS
jgi:CheY-like chemotaxis protein